MALAPLTHEMLVLTGFLLLIVDRTYALTAIRIKAQRILKKRPPDVDFERKLLSFFIAEIPLIVCGITLISFLVLGLMQVLYRDGLSNDVGRAVFGAISFVVSVGGSSLNVCLERIDLRAS